MVSASNIEKPGENADIDTEYWSNALGMRKLSLEKQSQSNKTNKVKICNEKKKKTPNPGNNEPVSLGCMEKERSNITK